MLRDPETMRRLTGSEADLAEGRVVTEEELAAVVASGGNVNGPPAGEHGWTAPSRDNGHRGQGAHREAAAGRGVRRRGFITDPPRENPHRVGERLLPPLDDRWSARRGTYRVLYRIDDEEPAVTVVDVGYRADIYRTR